MAIGFGVFAPQGWKRELRDISDPQAAWAKTKEITLAAEAAGYDSIWVYDHVHNVPKPSGEAVFECWTTMAALAEATSRIRLGQMVGCALYRPPAIVTSMWSQPETTYEGKFFQLQRAQCDPKPLQSPRPPVWIGGGGEQLTLRVVARLADWANFGGKPEEWANKREILKGHCKVVGRDEEEIGKSWSPEVFMRETEAEIRALVDSGQVGSLWGEAHDSWAAGNLVGTPEQVTEKVARYVELGCAYFVPWCSDYPDTTTLSLFAERVMPEFR